MQIFGNKSQFAISFDLDPNYAGVWLYGRFCYWIGNRQVGNFQLSTSLRDLLWGLRSHVIDNGNREYQSLGELPRDELFRTLDYALYGDDFKYESIATQECWSRFNIGFQIDIFDSWKIFLLDTSSCSRIIYKNHPHTDIVEFCIPRGMFDRAITNAFNTLFDIYNEEVAGLLEKNVLNLKQEMWV